MRALLVVMVLVAGSDVAQAQSPQARPAPRPRSFTATAGFGNAMGWFGLQGEKYLTNERVSFFGGLGYTPQVDEGDASGVTLAAGARGYTPGIKHRGFLELSISQLAIEQACFNDCRRLYGPGVQAGYQFTTRGGFTLLLSFGAGYAPGVRHGDAKVGGMAGLGFGYTWRR